MLIRLPVGGGKTAAVLNAIWEMTPLECRRILIISTVRIVEKVWPDEIADWAHLKDSISYSVLTGSPEGRLFALKTHARIYLVNRENIVWLWETMRELKMPMFDMIVIDESTMCQEAKKKTLPRKIDGVKVGGGNLSQFGAVMKFRQYAKRVVELTGTMAPNGLMSLYGQVYVLDYGERLGATKSDFKRRWFQADYMGYKYEPIATARNQIMDRVSDIVFAPDIEKHLDKIPTHDNIIRVKLSDSEMKRYKKFEKTLYEEETDIEAITEGVLTNKLLQFANGSMYSSEREDIHIHDRKLHALTDLVEELDGEPMLVAYSFQFDLDRILRKFPKARILSEDADAYDDWNAGKIKMLLAHPKSCAHGLNLQYGGYNLCWYGLNWSLELYQQTNGRLPRSGQKSAFVMQHHIIAEGTRDEMVYEKMQVAGVTQDEITEAVSVSLDREYGRGRGWRGGR